GGLHGAGRDDRAGRPTRGARGSLRHDRDRPTAGDVQRRADRPGADHVPRATGQPRRRCRPRERRGGAGRLRRHPLGAARLPDRGLGARAFPRLARQDGVRDLLQPERRPREDVAAQETGRAVTDIYRKLDVVDQFAEKVGEREAIFRSCDLMVAYLAEAAKPLPAKAAHALRVALKYKNGSAALAELEAERRAMMSGHGAWKRDDPEDCAIEALDAVLSFYVDPSWGGGAGEVVSNFWEL